MTFNILIKVYDQQYVISKLLHFQALKEMLHMLKSFIVIKILKII